jgi:hypothetical protein
MYTWTGFAANLGGMGKKVLIDKFPFSFTGGFWPFFYLF